MLFEPLGSIWLVDTVRTYVIFEGIYLCGGFAVLLRSEEFLFNVFEVTERADYLA